MISATPSSIYLSYPSSDQLLSYVSCFLSFEFKYQTLFWVEKIYVFFFVIGVYSICNGPRLSRGPYLAIATTCSVLSLAFVTLKASYVFTSGSSSNDGGVYFRAMEMALFLCSHVLAIGHVVVAYRTSCRERRTLLVHKIDIEAVSFSPSLSICFIIVRERWDWEYC